MIFKQIPDPHGIARLAKAARKRVIVDMKAAEKISKAQLQEQQKQQKERISSRIRTSNNKVIMCARCGSTNSKSSKYCNNCGFRFANDGDVGITNQRPSPPSSQVASSPSSSLIKTAEQDVGKFVTCELPANGLKINYPSDWLRIEKDLGPHTIVRFKSPKENPSDIIFETVGIALIPIPDATLEQLVQAVINSLKKKHSDFSIIESLPSYQGKTHTR